MKLYHVETAPSPRRVRIFMIEKGIAIPMVAVDFSCAAKTGLRNEHPKARRWYETVSQRPSAPI